MNVMVLELLAKVCHEIWEQGILCVRACNFANHQQQHTHIIGGDK